MKKKKNMFGLPIETAKCCQNGLYLISFAGLLLTCYFLYMEDAIQKSKDRETTVTKMSSVHPYEGDSIQITRQVIPSLLTLWYQV